MKRNYNYGPVAVNQQYYAQGVQYPENHLPYGVVNPKYIPPQAQYQSGYFPQPRNYYQKKKSGAKEVPGMKSNGVVYFGVSAWFYRKDVGVVKIAAFKNSLSLEANSQRGNEFVSMMFEVFYQKTGQKSLELALYNKTTGKVLLKKLGIIISTKAPNGGYAGFYSKKRNNNYQR